MTTLPTAKWNEGSPRHGISWRCQHQPTIARGEWIHLNLNSQLSSLSLNADTNSKQTLELHPTMSIFRSIFSSSTSTTKKAAWSIHLDSRATSRRSATSARIVHRRIVHCRLWRGARGGRTRSKDGETRISCRVHLTQGCPNYQWTIARMAVNM